MSLTKFYKQMHISINVDGMCAYSLFIVSIITMMICVYVIETIIYPSKMIV